MSCSVALPWDPALLGYGFGPGHPFNPLRLDLTMALARDLGVLNRPSVSVLPVEPASDALLATVHDPAYVEAVKSAGERGVADFAHGLGTADNPLFPDMHEATALVVGATVGAARAMLDGQVSHGVSIAGGLHHAMPATASGFCLYNDVAVTIRDLLNRGVERIAYVDVDVHHGDGVQAVFYDDPRVLTISVHESGRTLFPGTGFPDETGGPGARGSAVNVALPAGTGDPGWLRAFDAVVPPLVRAFAPTVLVSQHGCDTHALDPLANLLVSVDAQRVVHGALHDLAHEVCAGRWLATGGGGYEIVRVVPRTWTHLIAIASGDPLDPDTETPEDWRAMVHDRTGTTAPLRMTDGRPPSYSPYGDASSDPVDPEIQATREAVFPIVRAGAVTRDELVEHLRTSRVAGNVATSRQSNVGNIDKMLRRDWDYHFGLSLDREWTADEVLGVMAKRVGIDPDPSRRTGADRIDPDLTVDALEAAADLLSSAVAARATVFVATGHPTGVLSLHLAVAAALAVAGCRLLAAPDGLVVEGRGRLRSLGGVAMLTTGADFLHTHAAEPMQQLLEVWGDDRPDLVLADHGWAGAAGQAGLRVIGLADTNDPAMFVGAEENKIAVAIPLDDNVGPDLYAPLADVLTKAITRKA